MVRNAQATVVALFLAVSVTAAVSPQERQLSKVGNNVAGMQKATLPAQTKWLSHPPMRPLPAASKRALAKGPAYFVDPVKGADSNEGTKEKPWKTLNQSVKRLKPGDTLYLRGGTYYESVTVAVSGSAAMPITIRSYPGELAIIDAGLREFYEDPANAWEPVPGGAEGEYRSKKAYTHGGGFGNFGDSMVPLHRYITLNDLRSQNELWHAGLGARKDDPKGIYCGPGVRRDPETGRIHIRLAHTQLAGLGDNAYRGETDPRKVPLVIAGHDYALKIEGAQHIRIQDLVVRGAQRAAVLITEDSEDTEQDAEDIELDGLTIYGSNMALQVRRTRDLRVINCALHGHAAPWHSRAHHKYRAGAGYLVLAAGKNFEFSHSDFTDHHDCIQMYFVEDMRFHHNRVDNFNDDGIEVGPKKKRGKVYIYQNLISRCLSPFTLHGPPGTPKPIESEPGSGVYIYRNIVDLRQGTYRTPPTMPDPTGAFLNSPTTAICHDHGSPTHPIYYVYHNNFVMQAKASRGYYGMTWGTHTQATTRRVFNNIFVQVEGVPGLVFPPASVKDDLEADGNLHWGIIDGPKYQGDFFGKYRKSAVFAASKKRYAPGWAAKDLFADPKFTRFVVGGKEPLDLSLKADSPAINAGVALPADWPDPLRVLDKGAPDIGAVPLGEKQFQAGPQ